jgi:autotransporter-associated beta strand protein
LLVVLVPLASAATRTWTGAAGSSNFNDPANWGGTVPVDGDDVVLVQAGVNTLYVADLAASVRSLTLADNGSASHYRVDSQTGFGLAGGGSLVDQNAHNGGVRDILTADPFTLHGPATIEASAPGVALDINAQLVGTGPLTLVNNSGTDALRFGSVSSYSGATTIDGSFETHIFSPDALPAGTALTVRAGAGVRFGQSGTVGSLAGAGSVVLSGSTLTVGGDGTDTTFSGIASGTGGLTKAGSGTLTVSGVNTYTGPTTVSGGTLRLTGTIAGDVTVAAGATLVNLGTISGTITNNGTVATLPGAPTAVTASAGNGQATVSFTAPANGGSPITSYTVTASPGGATVTGSGTSLVVGGLTNGTSYTFTVTATSAIGTGPASAASTAVTPAAPAPSPSTTSTPTPAPAPEPEPPVVVAVVKRDVLAPSAAAGLRGSVAGGLLSHSWQEATDDVGVDHYRVFRGETLLHRTAAMRASVRTGPGLYTVRAVDAAGNLGPTVASIALARVARPAALPKAVPAWAWKLLAWQQRGSTGPRPAAAPKSPRHWYAAWRAWRLQPFGIVT